MQNAEPEIGFGPVRLCPAQRLLLVDGAPAKLGARAFDLLLALVAQRGRVVGKTELLDAVWHGLVVEENNLHVQIAALRKLLGQRAVATVPGRGYCFTLVSDEATAAVLAPTPTWALPELIGRATELAELGALLQRHPLLSLTGAGGIGKSSLARQVLHDHAAAFEHGGVWVDLSAVSDPASVPVAVAAAVAVQAGGGEPLTGLVKALAPLRLLLVLDNAEHLIDAVALLVAALRRGAPGLCLLVTSQAPLNLPDEQVYQLGPLAWPAQGDANLAEAAGCGAIGLFAARAAAADRRFALDVERLPYVIDICRRLDGLPLAIELAATRVPGLGVQRLQAALDQRFRLLTLGHRDAPERQQTLHAALDWSHRLLGAAEQTVFRRLAVFVGSFSLPAAEQVAGDAALDGWAVVDALGALVERALVLADGLEPPRYRLLETPRAFALACLQAAGEVQATRTRHALALRTVFEDAALAYYNGSQRIDTLRQRLSADIENGREALAWALANDAETAVSLAADMARELDETSTRNSREVFDATAPLVQANRMPLPLQVRWALAAALAHGRTRPGLTADYARRAVALCRQTGDRTGLYRALSYLAFGAGSATAEQQTAMAELRQIEDPHWPPMLRALGANAESFVHHANGDHAQVAFFIRKRITLLDAAGCPDTRALVNLIDVEVTLGRIDEAIRTGQELERRLHGSRSRLTQAHARRNLTAAWLAKGDTEQARAVAVLGWPLAPDFGLQAEWADYLALLCALERRAGCAATLLGLADALYGQHQRLRSINENQAAERVRALVAALPPALLGDLLARGASLAAPEAALTLRVAELAFARSDLVAPGSG